MEMENQLKPNGQRSKTLILWIRIVMALDILSLISSLFQLKLLRSIANGKTISHTTVEANVVWEQILAALSMIAFGVSAIAFIMWFRRAYRNLHVKVKNLSYSEGWAAGSWFVPILNLFRPYQIMKEMFRETKKLLSGLSINIPANLSLSLVSAWWTAWIVSNFLGQAVFRLSIRAKTVDQLIMVDLLDMVSSIVDIWLALVTIKLIKNYSSVEPLLFEIQDDSTENNGHNGEETVAAT